MPMIPETAPKPHAISDFFAVVSLLPRLNTKKRRAELQNRLHTVSLLLSLFACIAGLIVFALPFAVGAKEGGEAVALSLYSFFKTSAPREIGIEGAPVYTVAAYCIVILTALVLISNAVALQLRRKGGKGSDLFLLPGYLFGGVTLVFSVCALLSLRTEVRGSGAGALLALSCLLLFGLVVLFLLKLYLSRVGEWRAYQGKEKLFLSRAACVNRISAAAIGRLRRFMHHVPAIVFALVCILPLFLAFLPVCYAEGGSMGNLFSMTSRLCGEWSQCRGLIAELEAVKAAIPIPLIKYEQALSSLGGMQIVILVLIFLSVAAASAGLFFHFSPLRFRGRNFLCALPYLFAAVNFILSLSAYLNLTAGATAAYRAYAVYRLEMTSADAEKLTAVSGAFRTGLFINGIALCLLFSLVTAAGYALARFFDSSFDYLFSSERKAVGRPCHFQVLTGVTRIADGAFENCETLTSLLCADTVLSFGNAAFDNCPALGRVYAGNALKTIGRYAFTNCAALEEIVLPGSLTEIGDYAFYGCTSLKSIVFCGTKEEWERVRKGEGYDGGTGKYCVRTQDGIIVSP